YCGNERRTAHTMRTVSTRARLAMTASDHSPMRRRRCFEMRTRFTSRDPRGCRLALSRGPDLVQRRDLRRWIAAGDGGASAGSASADARIRQDARTNRHRGVDVAAIIRIGVGTLAPCQRQRRVAMEMAEVRTLLAGRGLVESPRWHADRLYFSDWSAGEVVAVDLAGRSRVVARVESLPLCTAWLPDGRLLLVSSPQG